VGGGETLRSSVSNLVTVVIPTRNEEDTISQCFDSVLTQNHQNLQIIVVDGNSGDATRAIVDRYRRRDPRVEFIDNTEGTIPRALDLGLKAARGQWLIRVDAHSTVPKDYVERALQLLRSGRWGGVGGRKDAVGTTPAGKAIATVLGSPLGVGGSVYHHGTRPQTVDHIPFGAYPTALASEIGGWDERILANEDFEFDYRLRKRGYDLLFDPSLTISWQCRQSIDQLWLQYFRYGRGKAYVAVLHPKSLRKRHIGPPVLTAAICIAVGTRNRRVSALILLPYLLFVCIAAGLLATRLSDARSRAWLPFVFPVIHFAWGLGFWAGLASIVRNQELSSIWSRAAITTRRQVR
jgi:succinoglycan biosynthesis protein ExoA